MQRFSWSVKQSFQVNHPSPYIFVGSNNFTSCSCIGDSSTAIRQQCDTGCSYFIPFVVITFILIFLTFWVTMPSTMATLRCVQEHERSLALGLQNIFIRLLGTIPGPVMFGYFIDNTCNLWNKSCGESRISWGKQ